MMEIANKNNNESGLTMIELIVAIGVFGLVISVVIGIFVLAVINQRRIITMRNINDNMRFAIESISREMRTGKNFSSESGRILFTNARGESTVYRLTNGRIEKSSDGGSSYLAVTGPEVSVNYLNFYLNGQAVLDGIQPRVTMTIGAESKVGSQNTSLQIQTTISQRLIQS